MARSSTATPPRLRARLATASLELREALVATPPGLRVRLITILAVLRSCLAAVVARLRPRRVPVVLQLTAVECGAACLAMVLGYFGRPATVAEIRAACPIGRDGVTAQGLLDAARRLGLRGRAVAVDLDRLGRLPLPAILHWEFRHFIVLERWSDRGAEVVDPACGRLRLTRAELDAGYTGVAIVLEPGARFDTAARARPRPAWSQPVTALLRLPGVRMQVGQVLAAAVLLQVLGLAVPLAVKLVLDQVLPLRLAPALRTLGLGILLIGGLRLAVGYLRGALLLSLQGRVDSHLMLGFFGELLDRPIAFFQARSTGDLVMRVSSHTVIRDLVAQQTPAAILDGTLVLTGLLVLWLCSPALGLAVLAMATLQSLLLWATTGRLREWTRRDLQAQAEAQGYLVEALGGVVALKAAGAEDTALARYTDLFTHQVNTALRRGQLAVTTDAVLAALRLVEPFVLLWVGAPAVLDGTMTIGSLIALCGLAAICLAPLATLVEAGQRIQLAAAHVERIADVAGAEPEQAGPGTQVLDAPPRHIVLHDVGFRHDPRAPWILRHIDLAIRPGAKLALVGRTGSGKTTLGRLLIGLYTPAEGAIEIDNRPLAELDLRSLRRHCGVVPQEPTIFGGSIRHNIALYDPMLPFQAVADAARLAALHDDIADLPMGYETRVGEQGGCLSGGQRQRLALARALAHRPSVLLLDEATSHLDATTERRIGANLRGIGCTQIVIAHRLSTIRDADEILVLDGGAIVERGTHDTLLAQGGAYAALVADQAAVPAQAADEGVPD